MPAIVRITSKRRSLTALANASRTGFGLLLDPKTDAIARTMRASAIGASSTSQMPSDNRPSRRGRPQRQPRLAEPAGTKNRDEPALLEGAPRPDSPGRG
jgi:hypothetical protein